MESEDEGKPLGDLPIGREPQLRVYDKEEEELSIFYYRAQQGHEGYEKGYEWADPRSYRILRFFRVLEGFHRGELDLTGRHPQRYESALKRWSEYSKDVLALARILQVLEVKDISDIGPEDLLYQAWVKIQMKWFGRVDLYSFHTIVYNIKSILAEMKSHPTPQFQRMTLIDLPPELLHDVFVHLTSRESQNLIATCRTLRNIGLRLAFKTRSVQLNMDLKNLPEPFDPSATLNLMKEAGEELKAHVDYLKQSTDLAQEITTMLFKDSWAEFVNRPDWHEEDWFPSNVGHLKSYHHLFGQAVATAQHLTFITARFITIDATFIRNITLLPQLYSLKVGSCTLTPEAQTLLSRPSRSQSITNLSLLFGNDIHLSMWYLLLICPNLRNLLVMSMNYLLEPPPDNIWDNVQFFPSLQYLAMDYVPEFTLNSLLPLFTTQPPLHSLTRVKYSSEYGVSDQTILNLIDVLSPAPLENLVLHGFEGSGTEIIDQLTDKLPNLLSLTLHRRDSNRQHRDQLADWPYTSATYAESLSGFTRLKHFCCNIRIAFTECSPAGIIDFEQGFVTEEQEYEDRRNGKDPAVYFADDHVLVLPFAARCPTLQTFAIPRALVYYTIERSTSGTISVRAASAEEKQVMRAMSPFVWTGWSDIIPDLADLPTGTPSNE